MRNLILILISYLLFFVQNSSASQNNLDWWQVQKDLTNKLLYSETDIAQLAKEVCSKKPKNANDAMFKLSVLMRVGMNKEAIESLRELKMLSERIEKSDLGTIYYDDCDYIKSWDIARAVVEIFPEDILGVDLQNRLLEYFISSGWSVEKVDNWLAEKPKGKNNFWIKERLAFNVKHNQGDKLIKELSAKVRNNPQDIENAIVFLDALTYARNNNETWDLSWVAEIIKPKQITQAESLASKLSQLSQWSTAKVFYQQALDMELTEGEVTQLSRMYQTFISDENVRAGFKVKIREDMSKCLLNLGMKEQAQKMMVEAADISKEYGLSLNAIFAGQIQAESGQRVIEDRILEEEKLSEDDPKYWQKRADYYRGRNEVIQEEYALKKGLALTTPQIEPEKGVKRSVGLRSFLLNRYASFLKRQNRSEDAVELLLKEISETPANSESAIQAVYLMAHEFNKLNSVDEEVLWTWLEKRTKWEYHEEGLLYQMLKNTVPAERAFKRGISENNISEMLDKNFSRAEKLSFNNDPTRACILGGIEKSLGFPKRSIALLKSAYENAKEKELKEKSAFNLLESYLDTDNWKSAEEIFPEAVKRLTYKEITDWYSRVAIAAAKSGAKEDAMRIWRNVANLYPAMFELMNGLVKYGLKEDLKDFYLKMQQKMPSSEVPAKARSILEK